MLQNRVNPLGEIIITSARGVWMGNRGVIHNEQKQIVKPFNHKAWIICQLQFKERKRTVMTPGRWTELFFLDEVTAFAAGHRPCFECRKEDAKRFKQCWIQGNPEYSFTMTTSIKEIDEVLHRERINVEKKKITHDQLIVDLPDGAMVLLNGHPYLVAKKRIHLWTPFGYEECCSIPEASISPVLTPPSILNAFRSGYSPQMSLRSN